MNLVADAPNTITIYPISFAQIWIIISPMNRAQGLI
jgi:hypothetical protein